MANAAAVAAQAAQKDSEKFTPHAVEFASDLLAPQLISEGFSMSSKTQSICQMKKITLSSPLQLLTPDFASSVRLLVSTRISTTRLCSSLISTSQTQTLVRPLITPERIAQLQFEF